MNKNQGTDANVRQAIPFFCVSDIKNSVRYYVEGLGFEMINKWIDGGKLRWCLLKNGGASLMLQENTGGGHHESLNLDKPSVGVSIYFICEDAILIYNDVIQRGVKASEPFVGNKMWVTGLLDPDGYSLYFESYTDVAEETTYSDWVKSRS